jgi:hypothetical protein
MRRIFIAFMGTPVIAALLLGALLIRLAVGRSVGSRASLELTTLSSVLSGCATPRRSSMEFNEQPKRTGTLLCDLGRS